MSELEARQELTESRNSEKSPLWQQQHKTRMKLVVRVCILHRCPTWVWRGKGAELAGAVCPMQRRAAEASATYCGTAMSVCFIFKGMTATSSRSFCISTDRTYGLPSVSFRLISGSNMAISLCIRMAAFSPLASSMWHLSSIVPQVHTAVRAGTS